MATLRNIFQTPRARVIIEERQPDGHYVALVEVTGLLCERL